jgi:hypothetical protein
VFVQQDLGEPYEPKSDTPDWEKLLAVRKAWKRGVVPLAGGRVDRVHRRARKPFRVGPVGMG